MTNLNLKIAETNGESTDLPIRLTRTFNLGYTMRDSAKMERHLDEIRALGIPVKAAGVPPQVSPISSWATITDSEVTVQGPETSGEIEIVTIKDEDGTVYVGVGSDQTDRDLEIVDLLWSKQVAPNIIAPTVWRWEDVADHWNEIELQCDITVDGEEVAYQRASVSEFWTPIEMIDGIEPKIVHVPGAVALFSGTVVSLGSQLVYAKRWSIKMIDPVLKREIEHTYDVIVLKDEILDDGLEK